MILITLTSFLAALVTIIVEAPQICASVGVSCQIPHIPYIFRSTPIASPAINQHSGQHIGVVSYFDPAPAWGQIDQGAPTVGLAIINPNDGPGTGSDPLYAAQVTQTDQAGITTLGYIRTGYAGTQDSSRTLATAEREVTDYYTWYPDIGGIFVDEVSTDCASLTSYYKPLYAFIKARHSKAVVVLNPGSNTSECYMLASDIIVEYDDTDANYSAWSPSGWESKYPNRFWHIITGASQNEMMQAIAMSRYWNVGWIYVTDSTAQDPFEALPTYWNAELDAVSKT